MRNKEPKRRIKKIQNPNLSRNPKEKIKSKQKLKKNQNASNNDLLCKLIHLLASLKNQY